MKMKLGKPIASGRTAEIYAWGDEKILKLLLEPFGDAHAQYELTIAHAVHAAGLPAPGVEGPVEIGDRVGIAYERIDGVTMWEEMAARPWRIVALSRLLADLHGSMHQVRDLSGFPLQVQRLEKKIREARGLSEERRRQTIHSLRSMPQSNRLCHGDFHPGNVILSERGPVVIDWIDATLGNPLADVARTTVLAEGELALAQKSPFLSRIGLWLAHREYARRYFRARPGAREEYLRWRPLVAAARLSEGIVELEGWLQAQVEAG